MQTQSPGELGPCKQTRIVAAGIACLDHIVVAPRISWGDTAEVGEYCVQGGGLAATALVTCARLGASAEMIGMLGSDSTGGAILQELRREKVGTSRIWCIEGGESPFSFIHVDRENGERTIFHRRATGLTWNLANQREVESAVAAAHVVLIDGYYPELARSMTALACAHRVPVVADASPDAANREWIAGVAVLIAPQAFLREGGFGERIDAALDAIHALGPTTAIVTLGADGWVASDAGGRYSGKAFEVAVRDTVGAGDVFHGAYAFALACGWPTPRCAEFASAVAALKCTRIGGRTGIPSMPQTMEFLRAHRPNEWDAISSV